MKRKEIDPLAYIENAFLDTKKDATSKSKSELDIDVPSLGSYLDGSANSRDRHPDMSSEDGPLRFRKTDMRAPRPRRKRTESINSSLDPTVQAVWESLPKNIEFLMRYFSDDATGNYYRGEFKESREDLIRRLLDPELSLEETARLLGVVPATIRRYTNRGWLNHHRTKGGQRRFRLSDVVRFVELHGRFPEE